MDESIQRQVGRRVRELRTDRRWTQQDLAEHAGMSATYVGEIERGGRDPGVGALHRLAVALGVSLAVLVSNRDEEPLADVLGHLGPEARRVVRALILELQVYESELEGRSS